MRIVITGANRGIGLTTAAVLARAGHTVYATMRDPSKATTLEEIAKRGSLPIQIAAMDVDSDSSVREAISKIQKAGSIDVMINNAGIERRGSVEELPISEARAIMETNYLGAIRCIQAVLPEMRSRRSGCIINVSSVGGRVAMPPLTAYAASKFALEALSEGLAQEVKPFNIRVAIVEPGIIHTDMAVSVSTEPKPSLYPHARRVAGLFSSSLEKPTPPDVVAQAILEIVEGESWQLRYPVGPDSTGYLQWRASMTDEQWVDWGAADDETWYTNVKNSFGLEARQTPRKSRS